MQIIRVRLIDGLGKTKGCEKAPLSILEAFKHIGSSEGGRLIEFDKLNLEEIHVNLDNIKEANHLIFENSKEAFEKNNKTFFIGGDHSISYSIGEAFTKVEVNPLLIVFDAHADCMKTNDEPNHEEWLRRLVEEGFPGSKVILISARNLWDEEIEFIRENNILWIKMDVLQEELTEICDMIMERVRQASGFYVSIDIDCVDPSHAPGTGVLESGGLSSRDLIYFLKRLKLLNNFKGADIVEINPDKDVNGMTVKLGAKLLAEMI
ncbi:MAG: arginase family protein [Candidatus Nanoarchaeia archaeon]|nr:arginase family protein [Candidatus Nanoarchaeia archaeon]MDD5741130.1 arginase family protein [Candidatus Nanoarchaeia archaeon]